MKRNWNCTRGDDCLCGSYEYAHLNCPSFFSPFKVVDTHSDVKAELTVLQVNYSRLKEAITNMVSSWEQEDNVLIIDKDNPVVATLLSALKE